MKGVIYFIGGALLGCFVVGFCYVLVLGIVQMGLDKGWIVVP